MENKKFHIMIVEDDILICEDLKRVLNQHNFVPIAVTHTGEDAIPKVDKMKPDLILMDIVLGGHLNGIETSRKIQKKYNGPIIFLTAYSDTITKNRVKNIKHSAYILKPFKDSELITAIKEALA